MGLRSQALKRAYALGHRVKIDACSICGKPVYNRMVWRADKDNPAGAFYAHQSCSKRQPEYEWERGW